MSDNFIAEVKVSGENIEDYLELQISLLWLLGIAGLLVLAWLIKVIVFNPTE